MSGICKRPARDLRPGKTARLFNCVLVNAPEKLAGLLSMMMIRARKQSKIVARKTKRKSGLSALQCDNNRFSGTAWQVGPTPQRRRKTFGLVGCLLDRNQVARDHGADQQGVGQDVDDDVHGLLRKEKMICCIAIYALHRPVANFESQYQLSN